MTIAGFGRVASAVSIAEVVRAALTPVARSFRATRVVALEPRGVGRVRVLAVASLTLEAPGASVATLTLGAARTTAA